MALGQRVALLDRGRLVQVGTPREVYDRPVTAFAARFVGSPPMNLIPGEASRADDGRVRLLLDSSRILNLAAFDAPPELAVAERRRLLLGVRPEHLTVGTGRDEASAPEGLVATVRAVEDQGDHAIVMLDLAGVPAVARVQGASNLAAGQAVLVGVMAGKVVWFRE
jgi:ABC-type sugar transport system ATPase subunit